MRWNLSHVCPVVVAVMGLSAGPISLAAESPPVPGRTVDFQRDVWPILESNCHHCHGPDEQQARLRLDARAIVMAGGNSGPAVVPGDPGASLLVKRLASHGSDPAMPTDADPLDDESIAVIRSWIEQGAKWPDGVGSQATEVPRHWAYVRAVRPPLPEAADRSWCRSPIDFFVHAAAASRGLAPSPQADPATWLRRVSLDLTGLPPSLAELDAFLADTPPAARERVVDRLLASPHFGEKWASPWLDAARYGDSTGAHEDELRPSWAWRDWVIAAFNADMPFDRFTVEQLAGDLLPDATTDQRIATGFHRASPCNLEAGTPAEARRSAQLIDRVNVTATVWLGTTLECAQCHNHKFDPVTQRDYYRLLAYFNNTPDETGPEVGPGRSAMGGPMLAVAGTTTFVMQELPTPRQTRIFVRGNYETPGETVSAGLPKWLHVPAGDLPPNRLGLARWIADPANPLTSRVTVNRVWGELFGAGLVRTPEDFGVKGDRPTHPELLDWLAVEFVEQGWSLKKLLRLIVLSATYGQSSWVPAEALAADPDNRWLMRAPRLRLSAEGIRDNALAIAGLLSPAIGGPPVYPPQPADLWWIRDDKSPKYLTSRGEERFRRSLYTVWRRAYVHPTFAAFDSPDRITCTVARGRTNTPLQALALLNDPIFTDAAFGLARRLGGPEASVGGGVEGPVASAFRAATARPPAAAEVARLAELYRGRRERFTSDPDAARELIEAVRGDQPSGLLATDDAGASHLAASFLVATAILNLDETVTRE
ncbi:MAG: PSD1 and planctomycete cytochrome C domain-containing protein [Pirellulales bacterium]